jgi:SAM-dependent methyltransferase
MQLKEEIRWKHNGRLEHHKLREADQAFWSDHWEQNFSLRKYDGYDKGGLGQFTALFERILPRDGVILEAGCGLGQLVLGLNRRGFCCEGVEYAAETVRMVKEALPDLPIRASDVTALDVPDGAYAGLVSLGVIEHRKEGPEPFLKEAFRVLCPGGVAFISVPYMNPLRRLKSLLGCYHGKPASRHAFYQYIFHRSELERHLRHEGFIIEEWYRYGGWKGLKDELPFLRSWQKAGRITHKTRAKLNRHPIICRTAAHMIGAVCRKPGVSA